MAVVDGLRGGNEDAMLAEMSQAAAALARVLEGRDQAARDAL